MRHFVLISLITLGAFAGDLNFNESVSVITKVKENIVLLISAAAALSFVIAGAMYITGKGNVGKEMLMNIMIGAIVVGVAGPVVALMFGQ